jgi:beta-hydroxylase
MNGAKPSEPRHVTAPSLPIRLLKGVVAAVNTGIRAVTPDPSFFNAADFPWTAELEAAYPGIRAECLAAVSDLNNVPNLEDVAEGFGSKNLAHGGDWKGLLLMAFGRPVNKNVLRCPQTYAALQRIPGVQSALFSILAPGVHLTRHTGPFAGVLRYHLGVIVPAGPECRIEVDDVSRNWHEGKCLIFDDTHPHEVWNGTDSLRVVLFVDFLRPTPWPLYQLLRAAFLLARYTPLARNLVRNAETI